MIVCVCAGIPERDFIRSLNQHPDWRVAAVECGAGQCCGTCRPFLAAIAQEQQAKKQAPEAPMLGLPVLG